MPPGVSIEKFCRSGRICAQCDCELTAAAAATSEVPAVSRELLPIVITKG